jgi:CheY-like chemotaxis protein
VDAGTGLRVLIVDDNHDFLAAASQVLEQDGLVVVGTASNGRQALRAAAELEPDAILVDVDLGEESGIDLVHQLAAADGTSTVLISVYAESELSELLAASPAVGFVPKAELSGPRVSNLLGRARDDGAPDR